MSVLLEALKKAAAEKKAQQSKSPIQENEAVLNSGLSLHSTPKAEPTASISMPEPFSLSLNIDAPANPPLEQEMMIPAPVDIARTHEPRSDDVLSLTESTPITIKSELIDEPVVLPELSLKDETRSDFLPSAEVSSVDVKQEPMPDSASAQAKPSNFEFKLAELEPVEAPHRDGLDSSLMQSEPPVEQVLMDSDKPSTLFTEQPSEGLQAYQPNEPTPQPEPPGLVDTNETQVDQSPDSFIAENPIPSPIVNAETTISIPEKELNRVRRSKFSKSKPKTPLLYTPTVTGILKSDLSLWRRRGFVYSVGVMLFVIILGYFALFYYEHLESDVEKQLQQYQPVLMASPKTLQPVNSVEPKPVEPNIANKAEPSQDRVSIEQNTKLDESVSDQTLKQTPLDSDTSTPPAPKPVSTPAVTKKTEQRIEVKQVQDRPPLELAYEAYQQADYAEAKRYYQQALKQNPRSRAAKMGLAALSAQAGEYQQAMNHYRDVLTSHPGDLEAIEGVASVAAGLGEPTLMQADLEALVGRYPKSALLQFALGNVFAQQNDWFKAQQHYFESVRFDTQNADYRLNLAVSLDHLGQYNEAIEQYKMSMALNNSHPARFDTAAVHARLLDLERFKAGGN